MSWWRCFHSIEITSYLLRVRYSGDVWPCSKTISKTSNLVDLMKHHRNLAKEGVSIWYRLPSMTIFFKMNQTNLPRDPSLKIYDPHTGKSRTNTAWKECCLSGVTKSFYFESLIVFPHLALLVGFLNISPRFSLDGRSSSSPESSGTSSNTRLKLSIFFFHWDLVTLLFFTTVSSHVSNASECFEWKTSSSTSRS